MVCGIGAVLEVKRVLHFATGAQEVGVLFVLLRPILISDHICLLLTIIKELHCEVEPLREHEALVVVVRRELVQRLIWVDGHGGRLYGREGDLDLAGGHVEVHLLLEVDLQVADFLDSVEDSLDPSHVLKEGLVRPRLAY